MAPCAKCGEVLIGSKKFCAYCGTAAAAPPEPAGRVSIPSSPPPVATAQPLGPPPRTSGYGAPPVPASGQGSGQSATYPAPALGGPPTMQPNTNVSPPYASSFPAPFSVGSHVLVQWADGNRYPGIVQQIAPGQCLIVFSDSQQRWVDNRYLASGVAPSTGR